MRRARIDFPVPSNTEEPCKQHVKTF